MIRAAIFVVCALLVASALAQTTGASTSGAATTGVTSAAATSVTSAASTSVTSASSTSVTSASTTAASTSSGVVDGGASTGTSTGASSTSSAGNSSSTTGSTNATSTTSATTGIVVVTTSATSASTAGSTSASTSAAAATVGSTSAAAATTGSTTGSWVVAGVTCVSKVPPSDSCFKSDYHGVNNGDYCGYCKDSNSGNNYFYCKDGQCTYSSTSGQATCQSYLSIKDPCSGSDSNRCEDDKYDVSCITNGGNKVCGGSDVYGPTEACPVSPVNTAVLQDGNGCVSGACVSGKCPGAAAGESCSSNWCAAGLYCDKTQKCQARIAIGATCTYDVTGKDENEGQNFGCVLTADCVAGKCVEIFSLKDGDTCGDANHVSEWVCPDGYGCVNKVCTQIKERAACNFQGPNGGCANEYLDCVCSAKTGSGVCVSNAITYGSAIKKAAQCWSDKKCWADTDYFPGGCKDTQCSSATQGVDKARESAAKAQQSLLGTGTSAAVTHGVAACAVALVALVLALVF